MIPPFDSDADFRVLHTLRCIGVSSKQRVATASGSTPQDTATRWRRLSDRGLVALDPGPFGGWALTEAGRATGEELVREELELSAARDHVHRWYEMFLDLNPKLLQVCTDWQLRKLGESHLLNDHKDTSYDSKVLSRLMQIHESVQGICEVLSSRLLRFGVYGPRLSYALERPLPATMAV